MKYPFTLPLSLISIHATREGGDMKSPKSFALSNTFQSTPPVRVATSLLKIVYHFDGISIHATREGGDLFLTDRL